MQTLEFLKKPSLGRIDLVVQRQVCIEVECGAPGESLTDFAQDDRSQQTELNGNSSVPQVRGKGDDGRNSNTAGCLNKCQEQEAASRLQVQVIGLMKSMVLSGLFLCGQVRGVVVLGFSIRRNRARSSLSAD